MKTTFTFFILLFLFPIIGSTQTYSQYFDGADTLEYNSLFIELDSSESNIWQIGPPQKTIFDAPGTEPNVIVTDTINTYPINDTSSFVMEIPEEFLWASSFGVLALQWKQKLDMDQGLDGGLLEFSGDDGATWVNAFDNPYVYNFYGFEEENKDTLNDGTVVFSGTDTEWKDIWFCFDIGWLVTEEYPIKIRFTFISDSLDTNKEGWMIDNLLAHVTIVHTISEELQEEYLKVYPNPTKSGIINIQAKKINEFHIVERMELRNMEGKLVREYNMVPTKFFIDISDQPKGVYFLMIQTNKQTETVKIIYE